MSKIQVLSPHIADLIAAGEVVERPASVVKELIENAVDAGASAVTVELRGGGMRFLRVTDDGCGMSPEEAPVAFLRHATSKLRTEEDLAAIHTMGFRGEALAAIASVSRVDLLTRTQDSPMGVSLHLEGGVITENEEAGCPAGTTIIVRDLFFNTPARLKFMRADSAESAAVTAAVQQQAMAHPQVSFRVLRDGRQLLSTPGGGQLRAAIYGIYGQSAADMVTVESAWEKYTLQGYVSLPSQCRASRALQIFFVNDRPVKSKLLQAALEEAYRNRIMTGRFPACVLSLHMPANLVDVNVHPAKTEVRFLSERQAFDCIRCGVMAALDRAQDRPELRLRQEPRQEARMPAKKEGFFRTMTPEEYRELTAVQAAPAADPVRARQAAAVLERPSDPAAAENRVVPRPSFAPAAQKNAEPERMAPMPSAPMPEPEEKRPAHRPDPTAPEKQAPTEQERLELPGEPDFSVLGELFDTYIVVEQGDQAILIDKHAAHERILFEAYRARKQEFPSQSLLTPIACALGGEAAAALLSNRTLLEELGYGIDDFGPGTVMLRRIPMDLDPDQAETCLGRLAEQLREGRREDPAGLRDALLHTMACKAAIKAGWHTDPRERETLARQVLSRNDLKHCPHGRPICVVLTKRQLERQFGRA